MLAAVVENLGRDPVVAEVDDAVAGDGLVLGSVEVAGLNPIDLLFGDGRYETEVPHVVGREGLARLADGSRVYFSLAPPVGAVGDLVAIDPGATFAVPDRLDDAMAIAIGVSGLAAWLSLTAQADLRAGESVLILGASGVLGQLGCQIARELGAGRVVGAARKSGVLDRYGLDAVAEIGEGFADDLREIAGEGFDVVIDGVGGAPLEAALGVLAVGGRAVNFGARAGDTTEVRLRALQGRRLIGHSSRFFSHEAQAEAYARMAELAVEGRLSVDSEEFALADVAAAWRAQALSPNRKLLIRVGGGVP